MADARIHASKAEPMLSGDFPLCNFYRLQFWLSAIWTQNGEVMGLRPVGTRRSCGESPFLWDLWPGIDAIGRCEGVDLVVLIALVKG